MSWKYKMILVDSELNTVKEVKYSCGGCGKKRRRGSTQPWRLEDKHGKVLWKNNAYQNLEMTR